MISLLSSLISLQNRQKCRFEPTLKKCSRSKALGAKKPYFMRLSAQTRRPEIDTKRPVLDTLTKRLEIRCTGNGTVGSNPTRSATSPRTALVRGDFFVRRIKKSTLTCSVAPPRKIAIAGAGLQFCFWMIDSKGLSSFKPAIADAGSRVCFLV